MKEKLVQSTLILIIGGAITKILGMFIKIVMARFLTTEGMGMYMLILPTFLFLINLSQLGLPLALSKLVAEEKRNNKKLFISTIPIIIGINLFIMIFVFTFASFISNNLLHKSELCMSIKAMSVVVFFTSLSSICRSYFIGKGKMLPNVLSNISEDLVRLLLIVLFLPYVVPLGLKYTVCFVVLINVVSEFVSFIILLFFIPKQKIIKKEDLKFDKTYLKESLHIGIPSTFGKMLGSLAFFLEPIVLTNGLLKSGYSMSYITQEYGIISGYVMPLILLPSFFTLAISQALLPILSKEYALGHYRIIYKKLNWAILLSLILSGGITSLIITFPNFFLNIIYNTSEGVSYIRLLGPICILEYIQAPLSSCLDAIGKTKNNMIAALIGMMTRVILLHLLAPLKISFWCYIIPISLNIIFTTFYQIKKVHDFLR